MAVQIPKPDTVGMEEGQANLMTVAQNGPLSPDDLDRLFDEAKAELAEAKAGQLGAPEPGVLLPPDILAEESLAELGQIFRDAGILTNNSVAWLVCQRNGVTSRSKEYLSSLIKQVDLTQVSMYAIFEVANRVEARTIPSDLK